MNSIFSSFDALSANLLGQSVSYFKTKSPAATTILADQKTMKNETIGNGNDNGTGCRSKGGYSARWAPEFDGLNCYESLVFH
ncbi:hypothetical protein R6Q57_006756 [Mikania cordata]